MLIPMGGMLPFGSIFIEMYFVFNSLWNYKLYYVYGIMLMVFSILLIVSASVSIVLTYFLLNAEGLPPRLLTSLPSPVFLSVCIYDSSHVCACHRPGRVRFFWQRAACANGLGQRLRVSGRRLAMAQGSSLGDLGAYAWM